VATVAPTGRFGMSVLSIRYIMPDGSREAVGGKKKLAGYSF